MKFSRRRILSEADLFSLLDEFSCCGIPGNQLFSLPQLGYKNQLAAIIIGDMTGEVQPAHLSGGLRRCLDKSLIRI